ncbi:phage tail protein [Weissella minor]|uniref:phage tail protein n=1 Tax=Weissella minor TaxID=1620 RepID=UPI001BB0CB45|nr:phage tail protein [Weissella minor]MBS0949513.1 phage tail protein [Weissella minor]
MGVIYLKNLNNDETATTATNVTITKNLGALDQLTCELSPQAIGSVPSAMMINGTLITVPETGQQYRLQNVGLNPLGQKQSYSITAMACAIDLHDHFVEKRLNGTQSLKACLDFIISGTPIKYTIHDDFKNYHFSDGFGGDFADSLLMGTLANDFQFEWWFDNYQLHIVKKRGKTDAFALINGLNATGLKYTEDYTGIRTYIKGYGKPKEQKDDKKPVEYLATAEYVSPTVKLWGRKEASVINDERFTNNDALREYLKSQLQDYPIVQYTVDQVEFNEKDRLKNDIEVGNSGWLKDRYDIDVDVRIIGTVTHPQDVGIADTVTFGNKIYNFFQDQLKQRAAYRKNVIIGKNLNQKVENIHNSIYEGVRSL